MKYFYSTTTTPLTYSICGQLISKDGFLHHKRTFDWDVLILVTEGVLHITTAGTPYSIGANEYVLLKSGEEHFGHQPSVGKLSYLWVHFKSDMPFEVMKPNVQTYVSNLCDNGFTRVAMDSAAAGFPSAFADADCISSTKTATDTYTYLFPEQGKIAPSGRIPLLFHQLMDLSLEESLFSTLMPDYALSLLMMELSLEYRKSFKQQAGKMPPVISSVTEWIKTNFYRTFTVAELAKELGYQADYLSSLFKKHMGISLVQYTNRLRIETSKNLLINYGLSIKEAAYSCGFPDEKYYMKIFKSLEGVTPTQYKTAFSKKHIN